jgi:hypothetical protein
VADFLDASMTPMVQSSCLKIGILSAAELANPRNGNPMILGKAIIVIILPKGNTPWGGATCSNVDNNKVNTVRHQPTKI